MTETDNPDQSVKLQPHHTDTHGIETVLRTTTEAEFFLMEEVSGYSMQVLTRSASSGGKSLFVIDMVRGKGIRTWKNAETAVKYIKKICPDNINPAGAMIVFKRSSAMAEADFRVAPGVDH